MATGAVADGDEVAFVAQREARQSVVIRSTGGAAGGGEFAPTEGVQTVEDVDGRGNLAYAWGSYPGSIRDP